MAESESDMFDEVDYEPDSDQEEDAQGDALLVEEHPRHEEGAPGRVDRGKPSGDLSKVIVTEIPHSAGKKVRLFRWCTVYAPPIVSALSKELKTAIFTHTHAGSAKSLQEVEAEGRLGWH